MTANNAFPSPFVGPQAWDSLQPNERKPFEEHAAADRKRFDDEQAIFIDMQASDDSGNQLILVCMHWHRLPWCRPVFLRRAAASCRCLSTTQPVATLLAGAVLAPQGAGPSAGSGAAPQQ